MICEDAATLARVAYQQGDYTTDSTHSCGCCGRSAQTLRPLVLANQGFVCTTNDFCRSGSAERNQP